MSDVVKQLEEARQELQRRIAAHTEAKGVMVYVPPVDRSSWTYDGTPPAGTLAWHVAQIQAQDAKVRELEAAVAGSEVTSNG